MVRKEGFDTYPTGADCLLESKAGGGRCKLCLGIKVSGQGWSKDRAQL